MTEYLDTQDITLVNHQGSWGSTETVKRTMRITAWVCESKMRGGFEIYDLETSGEEFYGEGGLWLNAEKHIVDYDGTFGLDIRILKWLDDLGLVASNGYFRKDLNTHYAKENLETNAREEEIYNNQ